MYVLAAKLGWLSFYGLTWFSQDSSMSMRQTVMPLFCLTLGDIAATARQARSNVSEVIRRDYVRTIKSKGFSNCKVIYIYVLKNALMPVIIILGMYLGSMPADFIFAESAFNIPGVGSLFVKMTQSCDIPAV